MPIVWPPALRAPSAAAAITPPSPPQTTTAPRSAMSRPASRASASTSGGASAAPIIAIDVRRAIASATKDAGEFGEVRDNDIGSRDSVGQRDAVAVYPRRVHPGPLGAPDVVRRRVADEQ